MRLPTAVVSKINEMIGELIENQFSYHFFYFWYSCSWQSHFFSGSLGSENTIFYLIFSHVTLLSMMQRYDRMMIWWRTHLCCIMILCCMVLADIVWHDKMQYEDIIIANLISSYYQYYRLSYKFYVSTSFCL